MPRLQENSTVFKHELYIKKVGPFFAKRNGRFAAKPVIDASRTPGPFPDWTPVPTRREDLLLQPNVMTSPFNLDILESENFVSSIRSCAGFT